jgi:hypothetical protein
VKFLRHLTAAVVAVAVIVGLGMLWAHASGGGPGAPSAPSASGAPGAPGMGSGLRPAASGEALLRLKQIKAGVIRVQSGNGLHLANTGNLVRTCMIEAVLAAVVITVSAARRRHRRMGRTAAATAGASSG